ncbi:MAG: PIN domain-containing protein [Candidatus Cloacimonetes bacterium]|nr:PIN domain-containing protein [Candidatus Cloacimonadota bacterium]
MKQKRVILDTGPIVAFLNKNDTYHDWAKTQFSLLTPPLITCESVISEACYLLKNFTDGASNVLELVERELVLLPFDLQSEIVSIKKLLEKYKNIPMSLADACLVRLSEQISDSVICTLDTDFKIYRKNMRNIIPLIFPENI